MGETLLHLAAHPLAFPFLRLVGRCGPVVRVPGIGVVVNDAAVAHRVLRDTTAFGKSGRGSSGALWTPVLGPSVLLNMDGPAHTELRRKLAGLFTPAAVEAICADVLAAPLARAERRLAAGGTVDLVDLARTCAGAVICAIVGLDADEAECRRMFARGEEIAATVRLSTKQLSDRQVATARRVLGGITGPAARAYAAGDPSTVVGRMRELGLSEREALGAAAAFFLTGTETVASFLPRLVALLCDHDRQDAEPGAAVEEALRLTTPSPVMLRAVTAAARVGTVRVRPGQRVVIATYNCTRVPGRGFAPERARPDLGRLWFGSGPHSCIGYPLATAQIRAVAGAVLRHAPLRVVRRRYATGVLIPGYRVLEVARA
ncbi:cytochrome P450 [Pseudonocardia humida]|uniref:Cytochrome P450 n=1 Tax=Pseudonocardia humida TaxID=2800819 RepID=A0ABT1ABS5_9PSEU|nr:cytochrome P450 [Pseudonocardia humida]MCO1660381.1 cytochrome P450 [Pseudonocardia humida]